MNIKISVAYAVVAMTAVTACHDARVTVEQATTDKSAPFALIKTSITGEGTSREQVIALMGYPVSSSTKGIFGVDGEHLTFTDSRRMQYEVTLLNAKAVAKTSTNQSSTSTKGN